MGELTFSEQMRLAAGSTWQAALDHRFFREVAADTVEDDVFEAYLSIEYAFVDTAARVLGYAVAKAPGFEERKRLAFGLHGLTTDQREYFVEAFGSLGLSVPAGETLRVVGPARGLHDLTLSTAANEGYEEILACMLGAEWLYFTWCTKAMETPSARPAIRDWVALHTEGAFVEHLEWMRRELDLLGPRLETERAARVKERFRQTLEAEISFHDAAYEASE